MIRLWRHGERLTAESLNDWARSILRAIHGGPGIRVYPGGDTITICTDQRSTARAGLGGGMEIPMVNVLPELPVSELTLVQWATAAMMPGGTGDGQVWAADETSERWEPLYRFTDLSGQP